jgi:hypothetical protein
MKIAFITGGLQPGRDGVGDYTRRLAAECMRQGHSSVILSLNDQHISRFLSEGQEIEDVAVPGLRLPRSTPWPDRLVAARDYLNAFAPDWVSLQFVPFAFHPRGLGVSLPWQLSKVIGTRPLHWMFHELWVLWRLPLPLRQRLLGQCQKLCLRIWLQQLQPKIVTTQLSLYQTELSKLGVRAEILPLHGNIPVGPKADADRWLASRCAVVAHGHQVKAGFFGNILATLDRSLLAARMAELKAPGKELLLLSAGKIGRESTQLWDALEEELKALARFVKLGELDEPESSLYFSALDYGLTSYPPELMGKSGSVAAMNEHGLPTIACGSMGWGTKRHAGQFRADGRCTQPWTVKQTADTLLHHLRPDGI